jgi:hypothetical protein
VTAPLVIAVLFLWSSPLLTTKRAQLHSVSVSLLVQLILKQKPAVATGLVNKVIITQNYHLNNPMTQISHFVVEQNVNANLPVGMDVN